MGKSPSKPPKHWLHGSRGSCAWREATVSPAPHQHKKPDEKVRRKPLTLPSLFARTCHAIFSSEGERGGEVYCPLPPSLHCIRTRVERGAFRRAFRERGEVPSYSILNEQSRMEGEGFKGSRTRRPAGGILLFFLASSSPISPNVHRWSDLPTWSSATRRTSSSPVFPSHKNPLFPLPFLYLPHPLGMGGISENEHCPGKKRKKG